MIFKELINRYFENRVVTIPYGADCFFSIMKDLEDMIDIPGLINLSEADLETIIGPSKKIYALTASSRGEDKADKLIKKMNWRLKNKLGDKTLNSVLFNIVGGADMTLYEVNDIAEQLYGFVNDDANIIFGALIDEEYNGRIKITALLGEGQGEVSLDLHGFLMASGYC